LDTPFTLYISNISHDENKLYNDYMNKKNTNKSKRKVKDKLIAEK
jgi:hypothetical protein